MKPYIPHITPDPITPPQLTQDQLDGIARAGFMAANRATTYEWDKASNHIKRLYQSITYAACVEYGKILAEGREP